jgi:drug/metabolite transporter (DMT)-like permease
VIGHTLINHALRNLSPTVVAIAILGEPVGAALLAWFMLGESLAPSQLAGFALVVVAILLAR